MKINYSILWLDDNINAFIDDGWVEKIEQYLIDEGFEPNIITVAKIDDFYSRLKEPFDLILTDFHMAPKNGDEVVKDIRAQNIHTEILFYTAKENLSGVEKLDRITFVETTGDHHAKIVGATKELIALTIKKFQHIIAMRGMIMHETSALDNQTTQIIKSYIKSEKTNNDALIDSICLKLKELLGSKLKIVEKIENNKNFNILINDTFLYSAEYKIESIKNILETVSLSDFTEDYKKEVSNLRNKFAHAILEKDETGRQYFKHKEEGITFDENLCKTLRKDINKHKKNIDQLQIKLSEYLEN